MKKLVVILLITNTLFCIFWVKASLETEYWRDIKIQSKYKIDNRYTLFYEWYTNDEMRIEFKHKYLNR